jgi:hypothetical protein
MNYVKDRQRFEFALKYLEIKGRIGFSVGTIGIISVFESGKFSEF